MADLDDLIFAAGRRYLIALDASTGEEVWRAKVKASGLFAQGITTLAVEPLMVIVGLNGRLTAFDKRTGEELWTRKFNEFGGGTVMIACDNSALMTAQQVGAESAAADDAAGASGGAVAAM